MFDFEVVTKNPETGAPVSRFIVAAVSAAAARRIALDKLTDKAAKIRVYVVPDSVNAVAFAALIVSSRACSNWTVCGMDSLDRAALDFRRIFAAIKGNVTAARIFAEIQTAGHDAQDLFSETLNAFVASAASADTAENKHRAAYSTVNAYISSMRAAGVKECLTAFTADENGDVIGLERALRDYFNPEDPEDGAPSRRDLLSALKSGLAACTPIQRRIVKLTALGLSVRQVSEKVGRAPSTVQTHLTLARNVLKSYLNGFNIDVAAVETAAKKSSAARHDAAYWRRYRAAKKAAKKPD